MVVFQPPSILQPFKPLGLSFTSVSLAINGSDLTCSCFSLKDLRASRSN